MVGLVKIYVCVFVSVMAFTREAKAKTRSQEATKESTKDVLVIWVVTRNQQQFSFDLTSLALSKPNRFWSFQI